MEPEEVTFQLLREMTDDFSSERILGEGSFAVVYRGVTHAGEDVAVKMLRRNYANTGSKQFKNEIYHLGMLRHQNIVQVLGYCYEIEKKPMVFNGKTVLIEEPHRAICLEYLHSGSLQDHLSDEFGGLDWDTRFNIIKGTCEGLKYLLHEEHLYHLDLKPGNILLDKDMAPKIADFGLSMIFGKELKTTTTQYPLGTHGYQPPEYIHKGEVSDKFDIYSLGVLMIKIVSGPKGYHECGDMSSDEFTNQVQKNWRHRLQETFNGSLLEMYCCQVETCIQIAMKCVEKDQQRRPDILMITEKLNGIEADDCTLPWNRCHKNIFRTTGNNEKRRKELKDITGRHHNIKLMTRPNCSELEFVDAQETSPYVVKELIVGRDEEKVKIVTSLLKVISETTVILPIYGIGGIGKTTLARLIYNDPKFKSYSQIWVDVTQRFDLIKIRESIVSQLSGEVSCDNQRQMMHNCLTSLLSNKKIFVILDDLWEDSQFQLDELKDMLNNKDSNIIVLVTTRSEDVADRICTNIQPHRILPLTNDMCWDIIKQRSGFDARDDNEQLISIGLEIAQRCGGVALAPQSLGFTLRSMNIDQWMKVKDSDIWNLPNDHVFASLKLSYSYMAPCLKTCFTYCSIFPKGHKMVKDDLIYQWISLDFIKPTKLLSTMHLCEKYIVQLLGLSFFQHSSLSHKISKKHVQYYMHDLVHDLARSVIDDELNVIDAAKKSNSSEQKYCRYVLLTNYDGQTKLSNILPKKVRALHFSSSSRLGLHEGSFSFAKCISILDFSGCSSTLLPSSIGQLKQLKCLIVPKTQNKKLPESIVELSKLQYLNLRESLISELPKSVGKLGSLIHLDVSGSRISVLPESFGNLKRMVHLDMSDCSLKELPGSIGNLTNLEHLDLSHNAIKCLPESICHLKKLHTLDLSYCPMLPPLPDCIISEITVKSLLIEGCSYELVDQVNSRLPYSIKLPLFKVRVDDGGRSNLPELEYANVGELIIRALQNVRFLEEACKVQLSGKNNLSKLTLSWTHSFDRNPDDKDLLGKLEPPRGLEHLILEGYRSPSFPSWGLGISHHLPNLVHICLRNLWTCSNLPPLGQLPNLEELILENCHEVTKIDKSFCGGKGAFPRLTSFSILDMHKLEEWITTYAIEDGDVEEFMFPVLDNVDIVNCPKLRLKPCPPTFRICTISSSHQVIPSLEAASSSHLASSAPSTVMTISYIHSGSLELFHHFPALQDLEISHCYQLKSLPESMQHLASLQSVKLHSCISISALPEWLGDLPSLKSVSISGSYNINIKSLPPNIQPLITKL